MRDAARAQPAVAARNELVEHGLIEDLVCSDAAYYDRHELSQPARLPKGFGTRSDRGCPLDCGLCPEHEQHTCIGLIEVTSNCNLKCPMCFAESGPGGKHIDFATYTRMVDRFFNNIFAARNNLAYFNTNAALLANAQPVPAGTPGSITIPSFVKLDFSQFYNISDRIRIKSWREF